jgi:hypothetical protein
MVTDCTAHSRTYVLPLIAYFAVDDKAFSGTSVLSREERKRLRSPPEMVQARMTQLG